MRIHQRSVMKFAAFSLLAALVALAGPAVSAAAEQEAHVEQANRIFSSHASAGYRFLDIQDNRAFLSTYDPLEDSPVFGFDLLYLQPSFGSMNVEGSFLGADSWNASMFYNRGADYAVGIDAQKLYHALGHRDLPADTKTPMTVYTHDPFYDGTSPNVVSHSAEGDFFTTRQDTSASLKVRAPGYPAHFRANGRISTMKGTQDMIYFGRTCGTATSGPVSGCHIDSKNRSLDQETKEYLLGADAHLGHVDLAYSRTMLTFRDQEPDPVDAFGAMISTGIAGKYTGAGLYTHNVNPDVKSFTDLVKLNTALTNRAVINLTYERTEADNQDVGITRGDQRFGANLNYEISPALFFVARYNFDEAKTLHLSAEAKDIREENIFEHGPKGHYPQSHNHALRPWQDTHSGELILRFAPSSRWDLSTTVRQRQIKRNDVYPKIAGSFREEAETSNSTLASLSGNLSLTPGLKLKGSVGNEWTTRPAYASDTTDMLRYSAGTVWTPGPIFSLQALYIGYRSKNDDTEALQESYLHYASWFPGFERTTTGNNFTLTAALAPMKTFTLSAAYAFADNGIEQDMLFGSEDPAKIKAGTTVIAYDTKFVGRTQVLNLRAAWNPVHQLNLTAEGMWVDGNEYYDPVFKTAAGQTSDGLKEIGTVEFSKLLASLKAEYSFTKQLGLSLSGFWARYDSKADADDGTVTGGTAMLMVKL